MVTSADIGFGSSIAKGDGASPEVFTALGEVTGLSGPSLARDAIDATHMTSTEAWREFVPGLKDGGEITVETNLIATGTTITTITGQFDTETRSNWRITFPDGAYFTFQALVTGYSPEAPIDGKMAASLTLKVSGKPTYTAAS